MSDYIEWGALANIVIVGVLVGAGLPTLFAVAVRAIAGPGAHTEDGRVRTSRLVIAGACFAVVIAAVIGAIVFLAAGGH